MRKLTKLLALIITLTMVVGIITSVSSFAVVKDEVKTANSAKEPEVIEHKLTTAEELLRQDEEKPHDYVEDGACPSGIELNQEVQAVTCDEILRFEPSNDGKHSASVKAYQSINDKASGTFTNFYSGIDFLYSDKTSFDPSHTGRKDHAGIIGFNESKEVKLVVLDLTNVDANGEFVVTDSIQLSNRADRKDTIGSYYKFEHDYSIRTATSDGKFDDILIVSYTSPVEGEKTINHYVEVFKINDSGKLESKKKINISDYMQNTILCKDYDGALFDPYSQRISVGDFDRDNIDELAVTLSLKYNLGGLCEIQDGPSFGATEVAIFDNIFNEDASADSPNKVFDDFIYSPDEKAEDDNCWYYHMMVNSNCTSGDLTGNKADDLIVGGFYSSVSLHKNYEKYEDVGGAYQFSKTDDKPGLVVVSFNGTIYEKTAVKPIQMNPGLLSLDRNDYEEPMMQTAYMTNRSNPCSLLFNGEIYTYDGGNWTKVYTYEFLANSYDTKSDSAPDYLYLEDPISGNLTNDQLGCESFAFRIKMMTNKESKDKVWYSFIATISLKDGAEGIYQDNTKDFVNGGEYTPDSKFDHFEDKKIIYEIPGFSIMVADVDTNDGTRVQYVGTEYIYTDPQVKAVIQAPPYFKELGDWSAFMPNNKIAFTSSNATTTAGAKNWSTDAGITVSAEVQGLVVSAETSLSVGYTHTNSNGWSENVETSYINEFSACAHDTVVLYRIPVTIFKYKVWDNETGDWKKDLDDPTKPYYSTTLTRLAPSYSQLTIDEYNKYVNEYNKVVKESEADLKEGDKLPVYLKNIKSNSEPDGVDILPLNAEGTPGNYRKAAIHPTEFLTNSNTLGHAGAVIGCGSETVKTSESSHTFSNGIHLNYSTKVSGGIDAPIGATVSAGVYLDFNYSWESSHSDSVSSSVATEGTVVDPDKSTYMPENGQMIDGYNFSWKYAGWNTVLQDDTAVEEKDEIKVPVLEFLLDGVTYPGQYPSKLYASADEEGNNVVVTWEKPIDQFGSPSLTDDTHYHIYRRLQEKGYEAEELATVDANTFTFTEPITNLAKGKTYEYYVGCDYDGYTSITVSPSCVTRATNSEYLIGDSNDNGIIDIVDGTLIQRYLADLYDGDARFLQRAGIEISGEPSITDVTLIQKYIAHISTDYDNVIGSKKAYK